MIETLDVAKAGRNFSRVIQGLKKSGSVAILKRGRTVAYVLSRERVEAMIETMEIMSNPVAMKAIRDYEAGKTKFKPVAVLDED